METYENQKNLIVRDKDNLIISANGFYVGDQVLSEITGLTHTINQFFEFNSRAYVGYGNGKQAPVDDFFYRTKKPQK